MYQIKTIILVSLISLSNILFAQTYLDPNASIDDRVEDLLSRMTLAEKIGQMTQAEKASVESSGLEDIKTYFLGSVLSGGGSTPSPNTAAKWQEMYNNMQAKAHETRLGIPIIYGVDAVHGHNNLLGATIFPHNIGLGCTRDPELVKEITRITALEVKATGPEWTFSPCITVPQTEFWGRTYEGFSESTTLVDSMAGAAVLGYQTDSLGTTNSILACAKHFLGDGGTQNGIDQGNTVLTEAELRQTHLPPYVSAINAGVGSVMASFNSWNGEKCHGRKDLLTDLLKTELGFKGFVVGDWNGINQVDGDFKTAIEKSINAGVDMGMQPYDYASFIQKLTELVNEGKVSQDRIDDAVRRILRIKFSLGLFENSTANASLIDTVGCATHRAVARKAVRESLVLLKNDGILPFPQTVTKILIAGSKGKDVGAMCGGWTITWQGQLGEITEGTTIYEGLKNELGSTKVTYTSNSGSIPDADFAVVVVGENPYAEGNGDLYGQGSAGFDLSSTDKAMVAAVKAKGIPMVIVLLSGRPLDIRPELESANAFIVAWLPGTEGGSGITDVLMGNYNPTGKLSHTWPNSFAVVPINYPGENTGKVALFPYGFGLDFNSTGIETDEETRFTLYPNPCSDYLRINTEGIQNTNIQIYDALSRMVYHSNTTSDQFINIPAKEWNNGIYVVTLQTGNKVVSKLIVKN